MRQLKVIGAVGVGFGASKALGPKVLRLICDKCFDKIDSNKNGYLDHMELQLCVYEVYNLLNKRFPGWSDPPPRANILTGLKEFDTNNDNQLDKNEFFEFTKKLFRDGGDKFFKRVSATGTKDMVAVPAITPVLKKAIPALAAIPDSLLSPVVGQLAGMVAGTK